MNLHCLVTGNRACYSTCYKALRLTMSGKGGRRSTTWKNNWKHGKTKPIRVPSVLANQIMEYAVALDSGNAHHVSQEELQKTFLLAIDTFVQQRLEKFHPNQYACTGSTNTRRWDELRKFRNSIAQEPNKILTPNFNPLAPSIR